MHAVTTKVLDFDQELSRARAQEKELRTAVLNHSQASRLDPVAVLALSTSLLPREAEEEKAEDNVAYLAHRKGSEGEEWDNLFPLVQSWLQDPGTEPQSL